MLCCGGFSGRESWITWPKGIVKSCRATHKKSPKEKPLKHREWDACFLQQGRTPLGTLGSNPFFTRNIEKFRNSCRYSKKQRKPAETRKRTSSFPTCDQALLSFNCAWKLLKLQGGPRSPNLLQTAYRSLAILCALLPVDELLKSNITNTGSIVSQHVDTWWQNCSVYRGRFFTKHCKNKLRPTRSAHN